MPTIIFHHHIYKNAGTTILHILQKNFGNRFATVNANSDDGIITKRALINFLNNKKELRAISSHHFHTRQFSPYGAERFTGEFTFIDLVLIRHPIARLVSMHDFLSKGGGKNPERIKQAASLGLRNWLSMLLETQPNLINNPQVGLFSKLGYYASPPSLRDLEIAKSKLDDFALIGTVEEFDRFCVCAEYFLQPAFGALDFTYEIQNAYSKYSKPLNLQRLEHLIGRSLFSQLIKFNQLDITFWETAGLELERRLQSVYRGAERLDTFRARLTQTSNLGHDKIMSAVSR